MKRFLCLLFALLSALLILTACEKKAEPDEQSSGSSDVASLNDFFFAPVKNEQFNAEIKELAYSASESAAVDAGPTDSPDPVRADVSPKRKTFTVTYGNIDGSVFKTFTVPEGDPVPVPKEKPTYEDEYYTYTFVEWDTDVAGVDFENLNANLTIYPKYDFQQK